MLKIKKEIFLKRDGKKLNFFTASIFILYLQFFLTIFNTILMIDDVLSNEKELGAIVELCQDANSKVTNAFLITKKLDDFGITKHGTAIPILRVLAIVFLYLFGKAEAEEKNGIL